MPSKKKYYAIPPGPLRNAASPVERLVIERINKEVAPTFIMGHGFGKVLRYKNGIVFCDSENMTPTIQILAPDFFPKPMWDRVILALLKRSTQNRTKNASWLREFLFPLVEDQDAFIDEVVTKKRLYEAIEGRIRSYRLESGITPLRAVGETLYYFDDQGTLCRCDELPYRWLAGFKVSMSELDILHWDMAMTRMKEGMAMHQCVDVALHCSPKRPERGRYTEFERLAQKIFEPKFERMPDNTNTSTFDRIRIAVGVGSMHGNLQETAIAIQNIRPQLDRLVIETIEKDPRFQRYGASMKALRLSNLNLTPDHLLEYIFEPKP